MEQGSLCKNTRGSIWHRWDPHLHAPGTLRNDQFKGDWDAYLTKIEQSNPKIRALGITDYFTIETYREVRKLKGEGRLPDVHFIFPNVEMRLNIETEKKRAINIHLLFSPEDDNHESEILRVLGNLTYEYKDRDYRCTIQELRQLGRAYDPIQTDDRGALRVGANQFKTNLPNLKQLFRKERWLRENCLVAVSGSRDDGTSGLQSDHSFASTREEIESFAHIIFSGSPSQRDYWLGKNPKYNREFIESTYGFLKPCLHGSDIHGDRHVDSPDNNRYCWIKGDLTFETLKQAVVEPEERVEIGEEPPRYGVSSLSIDHLKTVGTPWLENDDVTLNTGLVAVIGARGSGKTALLDIIARGCNSICDTRSESSFLTRATIPINHLQGAEVYLTWGDGEAVSSALSTSLLDDDNEIVEDGVRYLSQHFVNQLCSSSGPANELRQEMERVIFESTQPIQRHEADSFNELLDILLTPVRRRREDLRNSINQISSDIVREGQRLDFLPKHNQERERLVKQLEKDRKELISILPKGKEERAKRLNDLEQACTAQEGKIEKLLTRQTMTSELQKEADHIREFSEPERYRELKQQFFSVDIPESSWAAFKMEFSGDVDKILTDLKAGLIKSIKDAKNGEAVASQDISKKPLEDWPLGMLITERDKVKKDVGIDAQKIRQYEALKKAIAKQEQSIRRLDEEIKVSTGAKERRNDLIRVRREKYAQMFELFLEEESTLGSLYAPLEQLLTESAGELAKLSFIVSRHVGLDKWVERGESLLDLRKSSRFQGRGSLLKKAKERLLDTWSAGSASDIANAMDNFRDEFGKDLANARPQSVPSEERRSWEQDVAAWLYETDHISVRYGIEYDGVAIEQLSPGTRGIVLLLLYLAIDKGDRRPLLIDQPEENLDPKSVYEDLVPHFREVRKRRQVIIVTHNANLVVNTDVDQVIVAESSQSGGGGLPVFFNIVVAFIYPAFGGVRSFV